MAHARTALFEAGVDVTFVGRREAYALGLSLFLSLSSD